MGRVVVVGEMGLGCCLDTSAAGFLSMASGWLGCCHLVCLGACLLHSGIGRVRFSGDRGNTTKLIPFTDL